VYLFKLVEDVRGVIESLKARFGEYRLAMLYNLDLDASLNWNLIVSARWSDEKGVAETIRMIAGELHKDLNGESKQAISRITVLKADDPFVQDMVHLYPVTGSGVPIAQLVAGGVTEGGGFVFYSQPLSVVARNS
jgi:hypothetical protein